MVLTCFCCPKQLSFPPRGRAKAVREFGWADRGERFYCGDCKGAPPSRVRSIIARVRKGETLWKTREGDETVYVLQPSGRKVGPISAELAIASGLLTPQLDGLFGPDTSQTWRA